MAGQEWTSMVAARIKAQRANVAHQLRVLLNTGDYACHQSVRIAIESLVIVLEKKPIALAEDNQTSGYAYGSIALPRLIKSLIDPAIDKAFPPGSFVECELSKSAFPLPLSQHLRDKQSYQNAARLFQNIGEHYAEYCFDHDTAEIFEQNCDTLGMLYGVLGSLANFAPVEPKLKWCGICFRRYPCEVHRTNRDLPNHEYQQGRYQKVAMLKTKVLTGWKSGRVFRKLLGEKFDVRLTSTIGNEVPLVNALYLPDEVVNFIHSTHTAPWKNIAGDWNTLLGSNYPSVSSSLPQPASSFQDWPSFVEGLTKALGNGSERTQNALWVLYMLEEAEEWLAAESRHIDGRRTTTEERIKRLYSSGVTKQKDIAANLNITTAAVSKHITKLRTKYPDLFDQS